MALSSNMIYGLSDIISIRLAPNTKEMFGEQNWIGTEVK